MCANDGGGKTSRGPAEETAGKRALGEKSAAAHRNAVSAAHSACHFPRDRGFEGPTGLADERGAEFGENCIGKERETPADGKRRQQYEPGYEVAKGQQDGFEGHLRITLGVRLQRIAQELRITLSG